ncbi:TPA: dienelactone hydrolase family protein [Salmonella enterica]|uniref:Dienelactone hydrolase domain-containing protein n=4 Tax=Salmonella enterica TaxID=28901 RepID=A0A3Z3HVC3_SALMU|nr:dienelactone hydrolase family protein [Salmonella enterica]EAA5435511.1 hypothetical protein [Salmonella enterica subsp. enterica serovar Muenchen]EBS1997180.1 hypothetical protein [Salmonella enterica subsp. enterica serovar Infantis]EBY1810362.1 hypothetical protein [Salmonella enterica subsp. enterica serovar Rubislaw]ECG2852137.1 hypothetical protein [Salmonella enterica subsp. enterica serovar Newport]EDC7374052.1 hypothetical protein [Salmonella enterica subsp. enterica serovar Enteri
MLKLIENNENAVVVLHEIYGINEHIKDVCAEYHDRGFDVYCPHLFEHGLPFKYEQQDQAYKNFVNTCGFDTTKINLLLGEIRGGYKKIIMIGFSVGATIAWLSAESNLCDGIVCYYGSRIRDYTDIMPQCPVLVIMAQFEKSFDSYVLQKKLAERTTVTSHVLNSHHGFSDPYSETYSCRNTEVARDLVYDFIGAIVGKPSEV